MLQGMAEEQISLLFGHPDPATLLTPQMRETMESAARSTQLMGALQYGPEHGTRALVGYLVQKLNRDQGLGIDAENVIITAGSTGAVDMIARLFSAPGSVILVEAPSYADSLHVLRDHHVELRGIPMDEDGLIIAALERDLATLKAQGKPISLLYTVPNFHNPTGITLIEARRREILRLAAEYGFIILEDDVYRDLGFDAPVAPSFYALSGGKGVLSVGSFSKTFAPGMRVGWIVGSKADVERCVNCGVLQMGGGANPFAAQFVAEFCTKGYLEPHIESLRGIYRARRDATVEALQRHMPAGVTWTHPAGGFFIWITVPEPLVAREIRKEAMARGLTLAAGEGFFVNPADGQHNLRIAFSHAPLADIDRGVKILADVIRALK